MGPWEGGGGRHLTQGAQSYRCAATLGVGGAGGGGGTQPVPDPILLTRETHARCEGGSPIRAGMRVGILCDYARPYR